ncbi:MAG TPA: PucR family transcriptional regulator ligand-binding domain-containing protein [Actinospica sp.]|nr:PucR family transcriptional regulator ligand-binding domain-containing protein [Actinospica sp.]
MLVRELLEPPCALTPVTEALGLDRTVRRVVTTDMPDPSRYLQGGELIVTGMIWRKEPQDAERFVSAVAASGASALAAGNAGDEELPPELLAACRKHRLPLLRVPGSLAFATLTEYVVRRISGQRANDLGSVLERHRRLVAAGDPVQALGAILELIAADLGLVCWVVDSAGTAVASSGAELAEAERTKLARAALSASTLPARVAMPASGSGAARVHRSVFPIADGAADRITDWYLVLDGDWRQWDPQRRGIVDQVTDVLAAERARLADRTAAWRADAERLVTDLAAGRDAGRRLADLGFADGGHRAVVLSVSDPCARPDAMLDAALGSCSALIARFDADATAGLPAHAVALTRAEPDPGEALGRWLDRITPGLAARRIAVGLSDAVADAAASRRAISDARHALRLAVTKPEPVTVVRQADIASHALLLASIPDEVRAAYRDRLLSPILDYDRLHNSELELTLEAFLRASASWTRCAATMHIHVNTLRYRISRIEDLVGRPLAQLETQADLLLALDLRGS